MASRVGMVKDRLKVGLGDSTDSITIAIVNSYRYRDINRYYYRVSIHVLF